MFPQVEDVFVDPSLEPYFKPLLSYPHHDYTIHLLSTDGLYAERGAKYSESGLWGFRYEAGKYNFLGDLSIFDGNNYADIYYIIKDDFEAKKEQYLSERVTHKAHWEAIEDELTDIANFDYRDVQDYTESCYSYFLSKYNYKQTQNLRYVMELVAHFHHDESDVLLDETALHVLDEYCLNLKEHLKHDYGFLRDMVVCATEGTRFTRYGGASFAFLDRAADIVYILEYYTTR
ncbi:MAG: hypothetical protein LBV04_00005 [Deferribacteraceae bacterium]|nr:hypothetical protein [Deferribacteraceae bacterium]